MTQKGKTVFMLTDDKLGGAQVHCRAQTDYLKERGVDARLVDITQWRSPMRRRGFVHKLASLVNLTRGMRQLKRENPGAVFFASQYHAAVACFLGGIPCHTRFPNDARRSLNRIAWIVFVHIFLWHRDSRLYFLHATLRDDAPAVLPWLRSKMGVLENPAPRLPQLRHRYAKGKAIDALFIGRFDMSKNPEKFLRVVRASGFPFARLRVIGEGVHEARYRKTFARDGGGYEIDWRGWQKNPWALVDRPSVLFVTAYYEAIPTILHEAFASGVVVISSVPSPSTRFMVSGGRGLDLVGMGDDDAGAKVRALLEDAKALNECRRRAREWIAARGKIDYGAYFMETVFGKIDNPK